MLYGQELIKQLEREIELSQEAIKNRIERINNCETDWDDCFISQRCEERGISVCRDKINLIKNGGTSWFRLKSSSLTATIVLAPAVAAVAAALAARPAA